MHHTVCQLSESRTICIDNLVELHNTTDESTCTFKMRFWLGDIISEATITILALFAILLELCWVLHGGTTCTVLPHNSRVRSWAQVPVHLEILLFSLGQCRCSVFSRFSGFLPLSINTSVGEVLMINSPKVLWMCVNGVLWWTRVPGRSRLAPSIPGTDSGSTVTLTVIMKMNEWIKSSINSRVTLITGNITDWEEIQHKKQCTR